MADLLFLAHRMPYPPDKGDKIRSWHILRHLAQRHRVHLGCFYDDPDDARHIDELRRHCASLTCLPLHPLTQRIKSLGALRTGEAMSVAYFHDTALTRWVAETFARYRPSQAFVFCSAMAPYLDDYRSVTSVIDMVDVDSEKFRQYAEMGRWPLTALYRREGEKLLALETRAAARFDYTLFSSSAEAKLFLDRAPGVASRVLAMRNGVDYQFFDPDGAYATPYQLGRKTIVFTGAMDYRPNIEAAQWFVAEVMPALRRRFTALDFWIVGAHPARSLQALSGDDIHVTGRVPDMRPYLAHADAVVAPLQIARGIQNKVLEGMAMAKPVIATPAALEGLDVDRGSDVLSATTPAEFVEAIGRVLKGAALSLGVSARSRIVADYSWPAALGVLDHLFDDPVPVLASAS
jgi:sugar transferase (PEP-CTERM/EpsH1 system associated)